MIEKWKGERGRKEMVREKFLTAYGFFERLLKCVLGWIVEHTPKCVKPNHITALRIILVAPVAIIFWHGRGFWATMILVLAVASDAIDGALARVRGQKSKLGEVLDALADKILIITVLTVDGLRSGWSHFFPEFFILAVVLEMLLIAGRLWRLWKRSDKSNGSNGWGKTKMHYQSAAVICLVIGAGWTLAAANLYLGAAVPLAFLSIVGHSGRIRDIRT